MMFNLFNKSKQVTILVLVNKARLEEGEWVICIDVVRSKSASSTLETRRKQGFELHECLKHTGESHAMSVDLTPGPVCIKFQITGALRPRNDLLKGEDTLKFTGEKDECHRKIQLVRNSSNSSDNAVIAFRNGEEFMHTATIEVPFLSKDKNMSPTGKDECSSDVEVNVLSTSGGASVDPKLDAKPIPPRELFPIPPPSVTPDVIPDIASLKLASDFGKTDMPLSDADLQALAHRVPSDGRSLAIRLHVPDCDVKAAFQNHHRDVVSAVYECLILWRNQQKKSGHQKMLAMLMTELSHLGRNDLVEDITSAYERKPELAQYLA